MEQVSVVGLDLAKSVLQVHGVNAQGEAVLRRRLTRGQLLKLFEKLPPAFSAWKRASQLTTGRASWRRLATRSS